MKQIRRLTSVIYAILLLLFMGGCAGVPRAPHGAGMTADSSAATVPPVTLPAQPALPQTVPSPARDTSPEPAAASPVVPVSPLSFIDLTFAGDIMAHTVNYRMKEYARIYDDVRPLLSSDDLTFGNLETPVADSLPLSTYPRFNVHTPYLVAAVEGGFDVFSLANNHSNDQGTKGIAGTSSAVASISTPVFASGLKKTTAEGIEPVLIEKNGWRILFLSVTEILNAHDAAGKLVYYVAPTEPARSTFLADLVRMRTEHPCDVFVLSLHLNETEYGRTVSDSKKAWFGRIAASGVDVVWAHHPHVMQGWETVDLNPEGKVRRVLFMYSMGNFVSGQREKPATDKPDGYREYTGDAVLLQVRLSRRGKTGFDNLEVTAVPVTNYTDPEHGVVVRHFTPAFIETLPTSLQPYFRKRSELMGAYLPLLPTMSVRDILAP